MTVAPSSSRQMKISVVSSSGSRISLSSPSRRINSTPSSPLRMAIDYNDPGVMEEFNIIQTMEYDDVVTELSRSGVRAPADMSDMDVKLMLVELRTVMKGGAASGGSTAPADIPPSKFGSRFEEYLWTKPVFKALYNELKAQGDHNRMNVAAEYCNEPSDAKSRYYTSYGTFLDDVETALNARAEITTPKVKFGGFPANMGEFGLKATLEAVGGIEDIYVAISDDGISLVGEVTFESVEVAKAAIEQYDGMDMGMGDKLRMVSV
jgi:hypothetical protein